MKISALFLTLSMALGIHGYAQDRVTDHVVGQTITLQSTHMKEERSITVYLPEEYGASDKRYPVLYILDGQRYFLHAVSLHQTLVEFEQTPEFIVVGIPKNPSDRNSIYTVRAEDYLEFIEKEVIAYIDTHFRTSAERMLFGWAFGGGFVFETMIAKPQGFDAYIAASPFPLKNKIPKIDSVLTAHPDFDKLLYFSAETDEGGVREGTYELDALLREKGHAHLNWTFAALDAEEHRSTPFTTLYHALSEYFRYFPELQFNSLVDFSEAGGLDYVYAYYRERASRYGFSEQPSDWTMFSLTRNAIRADDFEQFARLVKEFEKTGYIERLRLSRAASIAEFYLDHQDFQKALALFRLLSEQHPDSEHLLNGLGDTYAALKEPRKAKTYYRKAKKMAQNRKEK